MTITDLLPENWSSENPDQDGRGDGNRSEPENEPGTRIEQDEDEPMISYEESEAHPSGIQEDL